MTGTIAPLFWVAMAMAMATLSQLNAGDVTTSSTDLAPSDSESSLHESTPGPPASPARVGLNGYRRYYANDSFIGAPIACSYEDKVCFQYNLLFHPQEDKCEPIGGGGGNCGMLPDRKEFKGGSGRLVGVCLEYADPSPGFRMEYDQRCYRKETVRDVICGGSNLTQHFLGGVECLSEEKQPISVQQPPQEGRCLIPDLRFPDTERSAFFAKPEGILSQTQWAQVFRECSQRQAACFSNGSVSVAGYEGCFPLLKRGPCPEDHVVALDAEAALGDRPEATCVHVRGGCARGHKRMAFDGQCHEDRAVAIAAPGHVIRNVFGRNVVMKLGVVLYTPELDIKGKCHLKFAAVANNWMRLLSSPPCGPNNKDHCALYELSDEPPIPEDD